MGDGPAATALTRRSSRSPSSPDASRSACLRHGGINDTCAVPATGSACGAAATVGCGSGPCKPPSIRARQGRDAAARDLVGGRPALHVVARRRACGRRRPRGQCLARGPSHLDLDSLSTVGSMFSDTIVKVLLVVVVGGLMLAVWKRWHSALFLATRGRLRGLGVRVVELHRPGWKRPPVEQLETAAPSGGFPSGHAAAAVAFYVGLLIVVSWHSRQRPVLRCTHHPRRLRPHRRRQFPSTRHAPTVDVIAGMLLGVASLYVVHRAFLAGAEDIRDGERRDGRDLQDRVTRLDLVAGGPVDGLVESPARTLRRPPPRRTTP